MKTIAMLKQIIQNREGVPPIQQPIIFAGEQLNDDKTLADYGIFNGTALHMVLRL